MEGAVGRGSCPPSARSSDLDVFRWDDSLLLIFGHPSGPDRDVGNHFVTISSNSRRPRPIRTFRPTHGIEKGPARSPPARGGQDRYRYPMARFVVDIGPLRRHRHFRRLWAGQLVSGVGSQLTLVAVAYQAYALTHSTLVVGLIGLVQLVPLLAGALWGGTLADAIDRRTVLVLTQVAMATAVGGLVVNASFPHPAVWPLFVCTAANAGFQGVDWPARRAALPMLVGDDDADRGGGPADGRPAAGLRGRPRPRRRAHRHRRAGRRVRHRRGHLRGRRSSPALLLAPLRPERRGHAHGVALDGRGIRPSPGRAPAVGDLSDRPQRHDLRHAPRRLPGPGRRGVRGRGGNGRLALRRSRGGSPRRLAVHRVVRPGPPPGPSHRRLRGGVGGGHRLVRHRPGARDRAGAARPRRRGRRDLGRVPPGGPAADGARPPPGPTVGHLLRRGGRAARGWATPRPGWRPPSGGRSSRSGRAGWPASWGWASCCGGSPELWRDRGGGRPLQPERGDRGHRRGDERALAKESPSKRSGGWPGGAAGTRAPSRAARR